ncbi:MAG: hypothetical protein KBT06_08665 [Prevotellaceae bacterium]|nr:hypothetical protein [Candidatus Colivivens equi]
MNSTSLSKVFLESQEKLRSSLQGFRLPKDYAELQQVVYNHIEELLVSDNEFRNSLNSSDAELLSYALKMALSFQKLTLSESIDFMNLSLKTTMEGEDNSYEKDSDFIQNAVTLLPTVICAFISPWLAMVAGLGTVGVKKVYTREGKKHSVNVKEVKTDISKDITDNEIQTIVSGIGSVCKEVDEIINKIQRDRKDLLAQIGSKIEDCVLEKKYPQIVTSLQYLFMEDMKSETKNQHIQNMIFSLQGYGYEVITFSESNSAYFTKKMNPNVSELTMYLPAIIREVEGTKVIAAQGIVYIPKN